MIVDSHFRRFVEIIAAERCHEHPELFDDCVQEGLIATWRAMESHPGHSDAYYRAAARRGVLGPLCGRPSFGHESQQGKQDAHQHSTSLVVGDDDFVVDPPTPEVSYIEVDARQAVHGAVLGLPERDREIVLERFWGGRSHRDIARTLGLSRQHVERLWRTEIRPTLAARLANVA